ncbi:MAG: glycosyltransferase family 2 protein [Bacteriovoracaceae bacterium]|nr:glycosyltransferase family 2 protein [Bacteriovoracaceae bacterium]
MNKLSVTLITLNEEANIERCIKSLSFAQEIIVVDSLSSDKTVEIAERNGAKVYTKKFEGYGQQKNYAASLCQNEWVLNIDADEEISPELAKNIQEILKNPTCDAYTLSRLTQFCGKWIYHGGWYPDNIVRLAKKNKSFWTTPQVHEKLILKKEGNIGKLHGHLLHYSFPSFESQVKTNLKYAKLAGEILATTKKICILSLLIRPFIKFIECYLIKKGFLDGVHGLVIALNASYSQFMKYAFAYFRQKDKSRIKN